MRLTVLSVAFPLSTVGPSAVGGAEQVLRTLDRALTSRGHQSVVIAPAGSRVSGTLLPTPALGSRLDDAAWRRAEQNHRRAIAYALESWPVDVVHMHGLDFHLYLPERRVPVLATLHLPIESYPSGVFSRGDGRLLCCCVSESQQRAAARCGYALPVIANGVELPARPRGPRRGYALALGRVCPEKAFHEALDAAHLADVDLVLAGRTFGFDEHRRYFDAEVAPRLDRRRRFIGPAGPALKRRLLAEASCLVVPSRVPETSSLAAMEALALGTPVIAFPSGALQEIVEHGRTGFIVSDARGMADAIRAVDAIDPEACRRAARTRFSGANMIDRYLDAYTRLASARRSAAA